jgi:hypothetical protein
MSILLNRDTRVFVSKATSGFTTANTVEILTLEGFNYNQQGRMNVVDKESMNPTGDRSVTPIIEQLSPVQFSFSTYIDMPVGAVVEPPDEYLWVGLLGTDTSVTTDSTTAVYAFDSATNLAQLQELTIWFEYVTTQTIFRLSNCTIDRAVITLDINELARITWFGTAQSMVDATGSRPAHLNRLDHTYCVLNKLSTVTLTRGTVTYDLALIGGQIEILNNNVYFNKTQMGNIIRPNGHYTGARIIRGDLEFYLKTGTDQGYGLLNDILLDAATGAGTDLETNNVSVLTINIGGDTGPNASFAIGNSILNIPQQRFNDVLSVSVPFVYQGTAEATMTYTIPS